MGNDVNGRELKFGLLMSRKVAVLLFGHALLIRKPCFDSDSLVVREGIVDVLFSKSWVVLHSRRGVSDSVT